MSIKTSCSSCGAWYNLADDQAGKSLRCRECRSVFVVRVAAEPADRREPSSSRVTNQRPGGTSAPRTDYDGSRRRGPDDDDDGRRSRDRDDPYRRSPRRRRGGVGVGVWLGIGGGVLVVLIGAVIVILFSTGAFEADRLTRANYDKVYPGMPEAELLALLGRPTKVDDSMQAEAIRMAARLGVPAAQVQFSKRLIWERGGNSARILVSADGLVVEKEGQFQAPPAVAVAPPAPVNPLAPPVVQPPPVVDPPVVVPPPPATKASPANPPPPKADPPPPVVVPDGGRPPLTSTLAKAMQGKTEAEVLAVLGAPTVRLGPQTFRVGRSTFRSADSWQWLEPGGGYLILHFRNGTVFGTRSRNLPS
jgi:hypothetical protein